MAALRITALLLILSAPLVGADATDATPEDVKWFVGTWLVTRVEPEGSESIVTPEPTRAVIAPVEGARITRTSHLRNGRVVTVEFTVKSFGGNFPWWQDEGSSAVARRVDANTFLLATIGPDGRADWAGAWRHVRVPAE